VNENVLDAKKISQAKAQRRKALTAFLGVFFAPLREKDFLPQVVRGHVEYFLCKAPQRGFASKWEIILGHSQYWER
jgi:hypothetical protein